MPLSPSADPASPATYPGAYFPRWPGRTVIGLSLSMLLVLRLLSQLDDPPWPWHDPAIVNIFTLVFCFNVVATLWLWLYFVSAIGPVARRRLLIGTVLLILGLMATFRYVEVTGHMVPRFVPRWSRVPDRDLGQVVEDSSRQSIDLATTTADDFPQFLGPSRNCLLPDRRLSRNWTPPPQLLWKRPIGAGWSAFSAVNGYAVTLEQRGDEELVSCYEVATGNPVWSDAIKARHENALGGIGPRSTPTIHQGKVYALGATGVLRCLDGATGKVVWKADLLQHFGQTQVEAEYAVPWGFAGSPLIVERLVVIPGGGPAKQAKNLIAFDAETGVIAWESEVEKEEGGVDQICYSSPALATLAGAPQIISVNEATVSGHDPESGACLWSHPWLSHSNTDATSSNPVPLPPNQVLLTRGYGAGAELLELAPASAGGMAVKSLWKNTRVLQTKLTNVAIVGEHVFGLSEGILECVELATGKRAWKGGRYGNGQLLAVGDLLVVLAEDGRLALLEANPKKLTELAIFPALEGKTWNNPCLYGKRLLIRNGQEAACYELP